MEILWYITAPDGPYPWHPQGARTIDYAYLQQIARAVDHLGFSGALLATGPHDTWILGSALIPFTQRLRFLIAVHPGLISPTLLAKMALTFDQFSAGRLLINVVNGDARMMASYGLHLAHDQRYELCDEYVTIWKQLLQGEIVDFAGQYVTVKGARLPLTGVQPSIPLWFGGSSPAALQVAAKHMDTYLSWGETPPQVAEKVKTLRALAAEQGRTLKFGIRLYVIVRETTAEAWAAAEWLLRHMDADSVQRMQTIFAGTDSVGQLRMKELHGGRIPKNVRDLEIYPNLWAGFGLVRPGPGTAIVGDPETVVNRLQEYADVGVDTFILSGVPLLEEAYRFADLVLPRLQVSRLDGKSSAFTWANTAPESTHTTHTKETIQG